MSSGIKIAIAFLCGVGIGGVGAWYYTKDIYAKKSEEDIESVKAAFHNAEQKLRDELQELKDQIDASKKEASEEKVVSAEKTPEKASINDYIRGKYTQYTPPVPTKKTDEVKKKRAIPYVISPDDFGENPEYEQVTLTYYADGILADDCMVEIEDIEEMVGDALEHFGDYEDDCVHCRSDLKHCDYEILMDLRKYSDVKKRYPSHNK